MKIAMVINGTRGDVQPMVILATGLMRTGHTVLICASSEHEEMVAKYHCQFHAFGPNYREKFNSAKKIKGGAVVSPPPKEMKRQTEEQMDILPDIIRGYDLLLGVGFVLGLKTVADFLQIPYRFVIFYPVLLGASIHDPFFNRFMFGIGRLMTNWVLKGLIDKKRKAMNLEPIPDIWGGWMGDHVIVACDKEIQSVREGVAFNYTQTGYLLMPSESKLPDHVEEFIRDGEPPVYIGFGSNPIYGPDQFNQMLVEVASITKQRLIVSKGWAKLRDSSSDDILVVDEIPFDMLFPKMSVLVHHGGTGTLAYAARSGVPQVAFPWMADQFENRKRIVELSLGPSTCGFKKITVESLSKAIMECQSNEQFKTNALRLSRQLQNSNGLARTIELIENTLIPNPSLLH